MQLIGISIVQLLQAVLPLTKTNSNEKIIITPGNKFYNGHGQFCANGDKA